MLDTDSLTRLARQPIPGDLPTGGDGRMQAAEYVRLDAAMMSLQSVAGSAVDWRQALGDGVTILEKHGKDMQAVSWLTRCLFQFHRLAGLAAGLGLMREMMTTWWETMHPARLRGRRSTLEWLAERISPLLTPADAAQAPRDLAACLAAIDAIGVVVGDRFDGADHGLMKLRRRLTEIADEVPPTSSASPGAVGVAASANGSVVAGSAASAPIAAAPATCAPADREAALARLAEVAAFFTRTEPHSPIGPLLSRAIAWAGMSFQQVFEELLREKKDAQKHLFDTLGVKPDEPKK